MAAGRALAAAALTAAAIALPSPAGAGPGDLQFATIVDHSPQGFVKALRAGGDFVKGGGGRRFRIILAATGVIVAIPSTSISQLEYMKSRRPAGLEIIACKETLDALAKANKRRLPTLPGIAVKPCASLRNQMMLGGWQPAPGL